VDTLKLNKDDLFRYWNNLVSEALKRQFNGVDRIQEIPWWVK